MQKSCAVTSNAEVGAGIAWALRRVEKVRKQVLDTSIAALMLEIGFGVFFCRKRESQRERESREESLALRAAALAQ